MSDGRQATLDNPLLRSRLRVRPGPAYFRRASTGRPLYLVSDILPAKPIHQRVVSRPIASVPVHTSASASKPSAQSKKQKRSVAYKPQLLAAMSMMVFTVGLLISYQGFRVNKQVETQVQGLSTSAVSDVEGGGTDVPSEDKPDKAAFGNYVVAPDMPRYLYIDDIGVSTVIKRLGAKKDGSMASPSNIYEAGWYDGSSKPGQPGAAFLAGHVHGVTKPAVFYNLKKLSSGSRIKVEMGDGRLITYRVVKTKQYPVNSVDMAEALSPAEPGKKGLNLMTCAGNVNLQTAEYDSRLVIFAIED